MRTIARALLVCCTLLSLALPARAGEVIVVAPLGGDGVALLQAALDAASDGDILLLKDGNYLAPDSTPFVIDGKGVSVIADAGAGPLFTRGFRVQDTPPGSLVLLRDLRMSAWDLGTEPMDLPLRATDLAGTLWLEGCTLEGEEGVYDLATSQVQPARPAAVLEGCSSVVMERCGLGGGSGFQGVGVTGMRDGAPGLRIKDTSLVMHGCTVVGGDAGSGGQGPADGGDALRVTAGSLAVLSDTLCRGGNGGGGFAGGLGGDGVEVLADGSAFWQRECSFLAGTVGGQFVKAPPGSVTTFFSPTGSVTLPGVVRVGQPFSFAALDLASGTAVFLALSFQGGFLADAGLEDALMLDLGSLVGPRLMGTTDGAGDLTVPMTAPFLPISVDGLTVLTQAFYLGPVGYPVLGPGSSITVVQTAY